MFLAHATCGFATRPTTDCQSLPGGRGNIRVAAREQFASGFRFYVNALLRFDLIYGSSPAKNGMWYGCLAIGLLVRSFARRPEAALRGFQQEVVPFAPHGIPCR